MRMRKHFATGAALTAAAAMILTACGGGSTTSTTSTDGGSKASDGPKGTITAGVAYETTDYGPITTSALGMGANWQVLEGLYRFNMEMCIRDRARTTASFRVVAARASASRSSRVVR